MAEFGEILRKARETKGMTQQSLAEKIYVTRQTISRWEGGERYPDLITLKKISSVLGIGIDELLDNKEFIEVAEKNPVVEKPWVNNIIIVLYALVVFTYGILAINHIPSIPLLAGELAESAGVLYIQLFVEGGEVILFLYGMIMVIRGRMNARKTGYVTTIFFSLEALRIASLFTYGKILVPGMIMIPYIVGAVASFLFYNKKKNTFLVQSFIVEAAVFAIGRVLFTLYNMLLYADHFYTAWNSLGALLTILIYVLFIYQMVVLGIRRKRAAEVAESTDP